MKCHTGYKTIKNLLFSLIIVVSSSNVFAQSITVNSTNYKQVIDMIGGDMERSSSAIQNATNKSEIIDWGFGDINFNVCRVQYDKNQELVEGTKNWAFYDKQVATMQQIKAIRPDIQFFGTMRSDYDGFGDDNNMPDWIHNYDTKATDVVKYGEFLADYCEYMSQQGVPISILSTAKEWMWHIRASKTVDIINTLNDELDSRGIEKPIIIDQGFWSISAGITYLKDVESLGTIDLYNAFCSHNYGNEDPEKWVEIIEKSVSLGKSMYDDETSTGSGSPTYGEERAMYKQIDEYIKKAERYEAGLSGEVYFEIWSRGQDKETRSIYFPKNGTGTRLRGYYMMKQFSNNILNHTYVTSTADATSKVYTIAFREKDKMVVWVINKGDNEYSLPITMDNSTITSSVATHYWTNDTPIEGTETIYSSSGNTFTPIVEAESMNCYIFNVTEDIVDVCSLPRTTLFEGECYDGMSGVETEASNEGTDNVSSIDNGDWIKFDTVDFTGLNKFSAHVASNSSGGKIELRTGSSDGVLIGELAINNTGGWQTWTTETLDFNKAVGIKDLYLVFTGSGGSLFNLNWIKLEAIPPSVVLIATSGNKSVSLDWSVNYMKLGSQNVYRNTSSNISTRTLITENTLGTNYVDTTVTKNVAYWYWIEAIDISSFVTNSEAIEVTPVFDNLALSGIAISETEINLSWLDGVLELDGFKVERKEGNGVYQEIASLNSNSFAFSDSGLNPETTYTYQVIAAYTDGGSNYSAELPVTTFNTDFETLIFNTIEDAYVRGGDSAALNFGGDINLVVKKGSNENFFRKTLLKFNLSAEDLENKTIGRVVLKLYANKATECTLTASEIDDNWSESTVTWNTVPTTGSNIVTIPLSSSKGYYEWDVTSYVVEQFSNDKIISILIEDFEAANQTISFNSKEAGGNFPELIINTVDIDPLSVSNLDGEKQLISLYPNPVTDILNIKIKTGEINKISIFDLTGRGLYTGYRTKKNSQINVDWLKNGIYFLKVETGIGSHLLNFIKE